MKKAAFDYPLRVDFCALFLVVPLAMLMLPGKTEIQTAVPTATDSHPISTPSPSVSTSDSQPRDEGEIEVLRHYTDQLLTTVRWTLGIAITLIVFSAGLGWYANFRFYERDKRALRDELADRLEAQTSKGLSSQEEKIKAALREYTKGAEAYKEDLGQEIQGMVEGKWEDLSRDIKSVRADMVRLNYELLDQKAAIWKLQDVQAIVLRTYMRMVPLAEELGWEWMISHALEGIDGALIAGAAPDAEQAREITSMLSRLPTDFSVISDAIRSHLTGDARGT